MLNDQINVIFISNTKQHSIITGKIMFLAVAKTSRHYLIKFLTWTIWMIYKNVYVQHSSLIICNESWRFSKFKHLIRTKSNIKILKETWRGLVHENNCYLFTNHIKWQAITFIHKSILDILNILIFIEFYFRAQNLITTNRELSCQSRYTVSISIAFN